MLSQLDSNYFLDLGYMKNSSPLSLTKIASTAAGENQVPQTPTYWKQSEKHLLIAMMSIGCTVIV